MRRTEGPDDINNEFTDGDPGAGTPATVVSADFMNIIQEEICSVIEAAGGTVDQATAYPSNNVGQLLAAVQVLGGGGGGGGFVWQGLGGSEPILEQEFSELVRKFEAGLAQELYATVKVPSGYQAGKQINLKFAAYSPSNSNAFLFRTQATLIRKNQDAFDSTTNQRTSTNVNLTNTVANQVREVVCDLTDASGAINSVAVAAGDTIKVRLYRDTDTDTGVVRMIPTASEVKFNG